MESIGQISLTVKKEANSQDFFQTVLDSVPQVANEKFIEFVGKYLNVRIEDELTELALKLDLHVEDEQKTHKLLMGSGCQPVSLREKGLGARDPYGITWRLISKDFELNK